MVYLQTTGAWGMDFVSSSPLFSTTPLFSKFSYKSFLFQNFHNLSFFFIWRHTSWIIRVFCIHTFSTDIYCISEYDWYWKISACSTEYEVCDSFASLTRHQTSYSGSAGWYFRYQSIHFQITYTYQNFCLIRYIFRSLFRV